MNSRRRSLAFRLTAWYTASTFVLVLATIAFLYWVLVSTLKQEHDRFLIDKARIVIAALKESKDDFHELRVEIHRESGPRPTGHFYVRVLTETGGVIIESPGMDQQLPATTFPSANVSSSETPNSAVLTSRSGQRFRAMSVRSNSTPPHVVHVAMDRSAEEEFLFHFQMFAGGVAIVALVVSAIVGHSIARQNLRPLRDITKTAHRVQSTTLHERLETSTLPAELADLAETFNAMLNRLEDSFRRLEQFSADIAHELRTPVNNLRGEAEVALSKPRSTDEYRETLTSALEEFGRLTSLIDTLLFLARAESPQAGVNRQLIDVRHELNTICDFYQAAAQEVGVTLNVDSPQHSLEVDRTLFQRAIGNLISNALNHSRTGSQIHIQATANSNSIRITVADTGAGIAAEHLPHVFDRFYRADVSRTAGSGTVGLGLALVKSIATLHGGTCGIESELGKGAKVWVEFPNS